MSFRKLIVYVIVIALFFSLGVLYLKTNLMERRISALSDKLDILEHENRALKVQYYENLNLSEIDPIARKKLKMVSPGSFIIIGVENGR